MLLFSLSSTAMNSINTKQFLTRRQTTKGLFTSAAAAAGATITRLVKEGLGGGRHASLPLPVLAVVASCCSKRYIATTSSTTSCSSWRRSMSGSSSRLTNTIDNSAAGVCAHRDHHVFTTTTTSSSIKVTRDVAYSHHHRRNVLDIYEPVLLSHDFMQQKQQANNVCLSCSSLVNNPTIAAATARATNPPIILIYFHGGMWMRGSKDQSFFSRWELLYNLYQEYFSWSFPSSSSSSSSSSFFHGNDNDDNKKNQSSKSINNVLSKYSNVGVTMASQGIKTYVVNYRLAEIGARDGQGQTQQQQQQQQQHNRDQGPVHPHQVLDVARAIAFVLQQEKYTLQHTIWKHDKTIKDDHNYNNNEINNNSSSSNSNKRTHIFIMGYSAGAHLSSLVLAQDEKYLNYALMERKMTLDQAREMMGGYISLSGVLNLKRLGQSLWRDITIAPAFLGRRSQRQRDRGDDDHDKTEERMLLESSPLHVILSTHAKWRQTIWRQRSSSSSLSSGVDNNVIVQQSHLPLIVEIPVLIMNAENDFHLHLDSKEMLVALEQFQRDPLSNARTRQVERMHQIIPSKHHLSIIWDFGTGFVSEEGWKEIHCDGKDNHGKQVILLQDNHRTKEEQRNDSPTISSTPIDISTRLVSTINGTMNYVMSSISSHVFKSDIKDSTASFVVEFLRKHSKELK